MSYTALAHDATTSVDLERRSEGRRRVVGGSAAFVAAWLVGLALVPVGVTSADREAAIVGHYVGHRLASIAQVGLVHAAAAVALLVFAVGLARLAESAGGAREARWARGAATVVVVTSLVQAVLGVVMITTAGSVGGATTRGLLIGVERLDAAKLVALAGLCGVGVVLARGGLLARWTGHVAAVAIACLLAAAVALAGIAPALAPVAVPALALLLVWVGGVGSTVRRIEA